MLNSVSSSDSRVNEIIFQLLLHVISLVWKKSLTKLHTNCQWKHSTQIVLLFSSPLGSFDYWRCTTVFMWSQLPLEYHIWSKQTASFLFTDSPPTAKDRANRNKQPKKIIKCIKPKINWHQPFITGSYNSRSPWGFRKLHNWPLNQFDRQISEACLVSEPHWLIAMFSYV